MLALTHWEIEHGGSNVGASPQYSIRLRLELTCSLLVASHKARLSPHTLDSLTVLLRPQYLDGVEAWTGDADIRGTPHMASIGDRSMRSFIITRLSGVSHYLHAYLVGLFHQRKALQIQNIFHHKTWSSTLRTIHV